MTVRSPVQTLSIAAIVVFALLATALPSSATGHWQHVPPTVARHETSTALIVTGPAACSGAVEATCGRQRVRFEGRVRADDGQRLIATSTRQAGSAWHVNVATQGMRGVYEYRFVVSHEVCRRSVIGDTGGLSLTPRCRWTRETTLPADGWYPLMVTTGPVGVNLKCGRGCDGPAPDRTDRPAEGLEVGRLGGLQP